jgi:aminoglycoside phosphotransferase (APT) family kinase protein
MIPTQKMAAVTRALQQTFGAADFEDIRPMTKGHTQAVVFRIVVRGNPYLLRINMRPHSIGPERYFSRMNAAAAAGLAPRVLYTSAEDEIALTDFVEEVSFPAGQALTRMPSVLRDLHALPPFPATPGHINTTCTFLLHPGPALDGFVAAFRKAVETASALAPTTCEHLLALRSELASACGHHPADLVSSHNDLFKPDNVLFDGQRVWLVDWEAAFLNDRYADLAVVANLLLHTDNDDEGQNARQERAFLFDYFGREPQPHELARFFLMRQLAHLFYAMAFLMLGASGKPGHDSSVGYDEFRQRLWAGNVDLANMPTKFTYGRVNLEQLLHNTTQPRYREALNLARRSF